MSQDAFAGRSLLDFGNDGRRYGRPAIAENPAAQRAFVLPGAAQLFAHTGSRRGAIALVSDNTGQVRLGLFRSIRFMVANPCDATAHSRQGAVTWLGIPKKRSSTRTALVPGYRNKLLVITTLAVWESLREPLILWCRLTGLRKEKPGRSSSCADVAHERAERRPAPES